MKYNLNQPEVNNKQKKSTWKGLKKLVDLMTQERHFIIMAFGAILINASLNLLGPLIIGYTIDKYVQTHQYHGVLVYSGILLVMYIGSLFTSYLQTSLMGKVGQRLLYNLRNALFTKLQELPVDFFNQNKAGDLISRINNDTEKINQFFSHSLVQFLGSIFIMLGAAVFLIVLHPTLGAATLAPALILWVFTLIISPWVKKQNAISLKNTGSLSSEVQESLNNFKVIVAFNRRDYFRNRFNEVNQENYKASIKAGMANNIFLPVYGLASHFGQFVVLSFGIYLIAAGNFTVGFLITFLAYVANFYNPLRQLAVHWTSYQVAMAGWDRISKILSLESNLPLIATREFVGDDYLLSFQNVSFHYPNGTDVLHKVNFDLKKGNTYAFVGPTGGGKTTAASLMARLYDPTKGTIYLNGVDIRSYTPDERARKIGFILQEPFLFTGTVKDNILYGNGPMSNFNNEELSKAIFDAGLDNLLQKFEQGLDTPVSTTGDGISLGQKQIIAFIRAVIRKPDLLILDEATANIDTVTEQLLDEILKKLPSTTTRVIIAHRLNTIENADEIYFVNSGNITRAGSLNDAVNMLLHDKRDS